MLMFEFRYNLTEVFFFFLIGPIDNSSALIQGMAWRRTGNKPLPEPELMIMMMSQFTDTFLHHPASVR